MRSSTFGEGSERRPAAVTGGKVVRASTATTPRKRARFPPSVCQNGESRSLWAAGGQSYQIQGESIVFEVVIMSESVVSEETVRALVGSTSGAFFPSKRPRSTGFVCAGWSLNVESIEGASTNNMKRLEGPQQVWKNRERVLVDELRS